MPTSFPRTLRSLDADGGGGAPLLVLLLAAVLTLWLAWALWVPLPVYVVGERARVEVERRVHPVDAPVAGRVVESRLRLGDEVAAGALLVQLDASPEERKLDEERSRSEALGPQIEAAGRERAAEERVLESGRQGTVAALEAARTRVREAETAAAFAEHQASRLRQLHEGGGGTEMEALRAESEARRARGLAQAAAVDVGRLERDRQGQQGAAQARIEELRQTEARLRGALATSARTLAALQAEIDRRAVRAPVAGRLDEVLGVARGRVVREGDRLASIVPPGRLHLVAEVDAAAAVGRVRAGQAAALRLDGYPWTEFGVVDAEVTGVGSEPHDGRVRIELALRLAPGSPIPLEHGMTGQVEIRVDRAPAATLLLRAAGRALAPPPSETRARAGARDQ
jgi:multidrug resistance efflux pump